MLIKFECLKIDEPQEYYKKEQGTSYFFTKKIRLKLHDIFLIILHCKIIYFHLLNKSFLKNFQAEKSKLSK